MELIRKFKKMMVAKKATKNYIKAAKMAEKRWAETNYTPQFVISTPDNECALMICDKDEFIAMRKKLGFTSKELTLSQLRRGCWYRTANKSKTDKMEAKEVMIRKMTYSHMCLDSRGLLDSQK